MQYNAFSKIFLAIGLAPFFAHAMDSAQNTSTPSTNEQYIVVLKSPVKNSQMTAQSLDTLNANLVNEQAMQAVNQLGVKVGKKFHRMLNGFVVTANKQQVADLAKLPSTAYIEPDYQVSIIPVDNQPPTPSKKVQTKNVDWGLARIDQHKLSDVDGSYTYLYDGSGVTAYVVDTGLYYKHQEFGGRASVYINKKGKGYEKNPANDVGDCNGHGTHVSGTIAGGTSGVAKNVNVVGVRVLSCEGKGSDSDVIAGLEEVYTLAQQAKTPSVVNMSLGGPQVSQALEQAVDKLVNSGIPVVVAAGNKTSAVDVLDSCKGSPAHDPNAITVSASDEKDKRASYSYYGKCTNIFAPGSNIISAWIGNDHAYAKASGTSMASPHVAGVVALYLQENPKLTPTEISKELTERSTTGAINMNLGWFPGRKNKERAKETPNALVYSLPN
ncbi:S8 family peptidase [Parashewanella tropica]|uniref:S8 family peptidase n=1 Tax=Parashewanella tropica TaxID=2547970 RepID=UPI0014783E64|nr:S8 family peptidase [Parashewanella tropica]